MRCRGPTGSTSDASRCLCRSTMLQRIARRCRCRPVEAVAVAFQRSGAFADRASELVSGGLLGNRYETGGAVRSVGCGRLVRDGAGCGSTHRHGHPRADRRRVTHRTRGPVRRSRHVAATAPPSRSEVRPAWARDFSGNDDTCRCPLGERHLAAFDPRLQPPQLANRDRQLGPLAHSRHRPPPPAQPGSAPPPSSSPQSSRRVLHGCREGERVEPAIDRVATVAAVASHPPSEQSELRRVDNEHQPWGPSPLGRSIRRSYGDLAVAVTDITVSVIALLRGGV